VSTADLDGLPDQLPGHLVLDGERYELTERYKEGWLSAVGRYVHGSRELLLKTYRARRLYGLPVRWITSRMARHEIRVLEIVRGIRGVPDLVGPYHDVGMIRELVEGHPLERGERTRPDFFDLLDETVAAVHARGVAYVDLSKRDNVLVGTDGRPHLFDFQIAWTDSPGRITRFLPGFLRRALLRQFQRGDRHHTLKHRGRAGASITSSEQEALQTPGWPIRLHRFLTRPYHKWRRRRARRRPEAKA
jgi:hypothetical protein